MDDGARHVQAARWVIRLGRLYAAVLVLAAAWSLLGVIAAWSPAALAVPAVLAACAAGWSAVLGAFAAHRRGAWHLLLVLAAVGACGSAVSWLLDEASSLLGSLSVAGHVGLLALLRHRDTREWVGLVASHPAVPAATHG
jgi:hypothetical protein